ncbi:MAG TPA: hypothetical protein VHL11_24355, partial [Phototrophicaceae bacterium]|nr:hypothetical protein [Phototrophicaceae bacterium]
MPVTVQIIDLAPAADDLKEQAARILHEEFNQKRYDFSWSTMEEARDEITMLSEEGHICRAALNEAGELIGFIGGLPEYDGNVWELHP